MNASLSGKLKAASGDIVAEVMREAEVHLNAQLTAAIAADARANRFASYLAAAGAVAIGASYSLHTASNPHHLLTALAALVGVALLSAAALALHSARPIDFEFAGNQPSMWAADVEAGKSLHASMSEMCAAYDEMIKSNRSAMEKNSKWFERARKTVVWTLIPAGLIFILALVSV